MNRGLFISRKVFALNLARKIYTRPFNFVQKMEKISDNPYFSKYEEKLKHLQKTDSDEFESRVNSMLENKQKEIEEKKLAAKKEKERMLEEARNRLGKGLDGIMKVDLLQEKTKEEIEQIWIDYHSQKDKLYSVISSDEYKDIYSKTQEFPTFLYPLPEKSGYEFYMQQCQAHSTYFTPLIQYQAHQENAPYCLVINYYTEFMDSKGIVLMVGEPDLKTISIHQAQLLALQFKMYYGLNSALKFNHVRTFKNNPNSFKYMDLIKEFESYKKDAEGVIIKDK